MKSEKSTVTVCTETGEVLSPSLTPQEKSLGFRRFIQLNCEYSNFLCNFAAKHPKALAILLFLEKNANTRNASCVTQKALCQQFKISNTTVWRQLKILQKANLIYVKKDKGLNFYIINPDETIHIKINKNINIFTIAIKNALIKLRIIIYISLQLL